MKIPLLLFSISLLQASQLFKNYKGLFKTNLLKPVVSNQPIPQSCQISVVSISPNDSSIIDQQIFALQNKFNSIESSSRAQAKQAIRKKRLFKPKDNYIIGDNNNVQGFNNIRKGSQGHITGDNNIILNHF